MSCLEMRNHYSDFPACLAATVPATSKPSKGKKVSSLGCTALHKVHNVMISFVLKDDVTHILLNAHQKIEKKTRNLKDEKCNFFPLAAFLFTCLFGLPLVLQQGALNISVTTQDKTSIC